MKKTPPSSTGFSTRFNESSGAANFFLGGGCYGAPCIAKAYGTFGSSDIFVYILSTVDLAVF